MCRFAEVICCAVLLDRIWTVFGQCHLRGVSDVSSGVLSELTLTPVAAFFSQFIKKEQADNQVEDEATRLVEEASAQVLEESRQESEQAVDFVK